MDPERPSFDLVVPTVGRPSLTILLEALAAGIGPLPGRIFLVDDRKDSCSSPLAAMPQRLAPRVEVLTSGGRGPAAARNVGWRSSGADWIVFLDDDVVPGTDWLSVLARDLMVLDADVGGSQGRIEVPMPPDRPPNDWERNVRLLEKSQWITADMAYRRHVLERVGGFDERFRRAYREDSELALRVLARGFRLARGSRRTTHPVRHAGPWVSVRLQAGNADDVLMHALHGRWEPRTHRSSRRGRHVLVSIAGLTVLAALPLRARRLATLAGMVWAGGTAEFAWSRIASGPRDLREVARMIATSAAIPPVASAWWLIGLARRRSLLADRRSPGRGVEPSGLRSCARSQAVRASAAAEKGGSHAGDRAKATA